MPFQNDVFISYAHIDDESLIEGKPGWISEFHRVLQIRLGQLIGEAPRIWRDAKLRGNDDFAEELDEKCPDSAVLVSVFSPRYLKSDWCQRELNAFASRPGPSIGNRSRVFKVLKTPVPREAEPAVVQPLLGYEFFQRDDARGRHRELQNTSDDEYLARLDDLAHDISETLALIGTQDAVAAPANDAAVDAAEAVAVYLASTTSDVSPRRDQLAREFQQRGIAVLPDRPLPLVAAECRDGVRSMLDRAVMSVHLVGSYYGTIPEGADRSLVHLEYDLARARSTEPDFAQLVWASSELEPAEDRQERFLEALRAGLDDVHRTELVSMGIEAFKSFALDKLETRTREADEPARPDDAPPSVYVVYMDADLNAAEAVTEYLYDEGFDLMQPVFEGDETDLRKLHLAHLQDCDAVLYVYDRAPALWLETKLRDLRKSLGYGRETPVRAKAIYITGEETTHKRMFRSREALVLKDFEASPAAALAPFVRALREEAPTS